MRRRLVLRSGAVPSLTQLAPSRRHFVLLCKSFADLWVESLLVLIPGSPPAAVTQLVFAGVALLTLWVLKTLITVIAWTGASTLAVVCLARWLRFSDADDDPRDRRRGARPREERWSSRDDDTLEVRFGS